MCLGALRAEHSLKVARSARDVRAQCKDSPNEAHGGDFGANEAGGVGANEARTELDLRLV